MRHRKECKTKIGYCTNCKDIRKYNGSLEVLQLSIVIIIIVIQYVYLLSQAFLPGTSLEPAVIPTAHNSSFTLQYFPYYV